MLAGAWRPSPRISRAGPLDPATRPQAAGPGVGLEHLAAPRRAGLAKANGAELAEDPRVGFGGPRANPTRDF
eukprot:6887493-Pyramimonas_sp.AAC.1